MAHGRGATPLVSIGLPVYNGGEAVRRALDSLLAQDYPHFELIVSDNASTDGTWDILQAYAARDPRIKLYRNAHNEGAARNFTRVYELAAGEYFMWAAHDDRWEPGFVSLCVQHLLAHPAAAVCYAGQPATPFRTAPALDHAEAWQRARSLLDTWPAPAVAIYGLFRRAALRPALPALDVEGPDAVILMHTALASPIHILPQTLHHYTRAPRTIKVRLQQMGHRITVFNVWRWDFRLLWVMLALSQRAAPNLRARWLLLRALLGFFTRITGWPRPRGMAKRYSALLPDETYFGVTNWLTRHPRLAAALRRVTGLELRPPAPQAPDQPFNGGARDLPEREPGSPVR